MQKESAYTRELCAITQALAKFRHYLLGHKFVIRTDQTSLKELMEQHLHTPEQQKWLHKFLGFDFVIQYKPGKENVVVDALSRSLHLALFLSVPDLSQQLRKLIQLDPEMSLVYKQCLASPTTVQNYEVKQGLLYWKGRLVIPQNQALKQQILYEFHSLTIGGDASMARIIASVCSQFY